MNGSALVSIIIPTRNRADLIVQTLASVCAQTYENWECLVIDDASTDATGQVVRDLAQRDPRIKYEARQSIGGPGASRNQGLEHAGGKYVLFLDSDDLLAVHCLAVRVTAMEADPALDFATFGIDVFNQAPGDWGLLWNAPSPLDDLSRFLDLDSVWQTMGPIWRRDSLARLGPWEPSLLSFEDWEFHVRALILGMKYRKHAEVDCFYRYPAGRNAISLRAYSVDHLRSHAVLVERVARLLREHDALSEPRRRRLIGLYLWIAGRLSRGKMNRESSAIWRRCRQQGLIGRFAWAEGRAFLIGQKIPLLRRMLRRYLLARWPGEMIRKGSRTFLNTPARPGAAVRPARGLPVNLYEFPA